MDGDGVVRIGVKHDSDGRKAKGNLVTLVIKSGYGPENVLESGHIHGVRHGDWVCFERKHIGCSHNHDAFVVGIMKCAIGDTNGGKGVSDESEVFQEWDHVVGRAGVQDRSFFIHNNFKVGVLNCLVIVERRYFFLERIDDGPLLGVMHAQCRLGIYNAATRWSVVWMVSI